MPAARLPAWSSSCPAGSPTARRQTRSSSWCARSSTSCSANSTRLRPRIEPMPTRKDSLLPRLKKILEDDSGLELADSEVSATFLELGLDSLFLTQFVLSIQGTFGVKVSFRQLMEDLSSLNSLAEHIDRTLPATGQAQEAVVDRPAPVD